VDKAVQSHLWKTKSTLIKQPFNGDLLPKPLPHTEEKEFLVTSRPTPSKNHDLIRKLVRDYPLNVLGANGIYTNQELAEAYSRAVAVIDASKFPEPHRRSQYSLLEAWHFGCPFLCFSEWFNDDEVLEGYSCLELTRKNINMVWKNTKNNNDALIRIGKFMLEKHKPDAVWQSIMREM